MSMMSEIWTTLAPMTANRVTAMPLDYRTLSKKWLISPMIAVPKKKSNYKRILDSSLPVWKSVPEMLQNVWLLLCKMKGEVARLATHMIVLLLLMGPNQQPQLEYSTLKKFASVSFSEFLFHIQILDTWKKHWTFIQITLLIVCNWEFRFGLFTFLHTFFLLSTYVINYS